jgi:hypothetical protein
MIRRQGSRFQGIEEEVALETRQKKTLAEDGRLEKAGFTGPAREEWQKPLLEKLPLHDALSGSIPVSPGDGFSSS